MNKKVQVQRICPICTRAFDMLNEDDAYEWCYGHDCEEA